MIKLWILHFTAVLQDNWTALISAAKEGHLDIVRELIHRADIEHKEMVRSKEYLWVIDALYYLFLLFVLPFQYHGTSHEDRPS